MKDAHQRIIWGINFSHDDVFFATASREKQQAVKVWHGVNSDQLLHSELPANSVSASTAVRFFPRKVKEQYAILVGQETGEISAWTLKETQW